MRRMNSSFVLASRSLTDERAKPPSKKWTCESMKPGATIMPCASTTRSAGVTRLRMAALDPTASMRSPWTSTASAQGRRRSPVQTRALTMASVPTGAGAGRRAAEGDGCCMAREESGSARASAATRAARRIVDMQECVPRRIRAEGALDVWHAVRRAFPMIATSIWFWVGFIAFVLAMLALDLGVFNRTPHVVRAREAATWTAVWVGLALLFALGLAIFETHQAALTFLTGYVIEESLSVDNIFVIVLIFQYFAVPAQYQHRVLFWGILGALVMRGLFIALGAALLARFEWIIYIFGALLVVTGIRMAVKQDEEFDASQNPIVKFVRRFLPITHDYHGKHFFAVENGKRYATPLLL